MGKTKKLILMVGLPASGKSTYVKENFRGKERVACLSRDDVRRDLKERMGKNFQESMTIEEMLDWSVAMLGLSGVDKVVLDATFTKRKLRNRVINHIKEKMLEQGIEIKTTLVFMRTALWKCLERNAGRPDETRVPEERMIEFAEQFVFPSDEDSHDFLTIVFDKEFPYTKEQGSYAWQLEGYRKPRVWITSDLHFGHDREFMWDKRGFASIETHDRHLVINFNELVAPWDKVYLLGDLMLMDNDRGKELLQSLNGRITVILGNHDSPKRVEIYQELFGKENVKYADIVKYNKNFSFFLCHYPVDTSNYDFRSIYSVHGHTHSQEKWNHEKKTYNVCPEAHNNYPVLLDDIVDFIRKEKGKNE